jgi:hypothetical protein
MKQRIEQLMCECDQVSEQMVALVEVGRSVPVSDLSKILRRARQLHAEMQTLMRLSVEAS